jgi:aryl-alcohol dehydrogenase-like predicted oxidoreductase
LVDATKSHVKSARQKLGSRLVSVQNRCNLMERQDLDSGLVSDLEGQGMTYLSRASLGGDHHRKLQGKLFGLRGLADKHEASVSELMLSWLMLSPNILPLPGASTIDEVDSCAHATEIELDLDDLEELERVVSGAML